MKKIFIIIVMFFLIGLITNKTFAKSNNNNKMQDYKEAEEIINVQKDNLKISDFIKESEKYTKDNMPGLNLNEIFSSAITGDIDNIKMMHILFNLVSKELSNCLSAIVGIIVVIVIHGILKSIGDSLGNKGVVQIAYYIQYILIVTIIMSNFAEIIIMVKTSIQNLVTFINLLIPILITLLITTGSITTASIIQPIIIFITTLIGNFIVKVIIPITLVSTALGIISQISDKIQIDKLSKFLKSGAVWSLGVILTLFVGITSLESTLTSQVDGVSAKTTKAAVSNFIPVVGKILGDAVETVMGCSIILKNALGILGIIIIVSICIAPIIKLIILMSMYYLCAALCQPIADSKIIKLLSHIGDTYKLLLAILSSVSVMLIIGVTIIIKISNTGNIT